MGEFGLSFRGSEYLLFIWSQKNERMRVPFWSETTIEVHGSRYDEHPQ